MDRPRDSYQQQQPQFNSSTGSPSLIRTDSNSSNHSGTFLNLASRGSPQPGGGSPVSGNVNRNSGDVSDFNRRDISQRRPVSYDNSSSPVPSDGFHSPTPRMRQQEPNSTTIRTPPLSQAGSTNSNSSQHSSNYLNTPNGGNSPSSSQFEVSSGESMNLNLSERRRKLTPSTDYSLPYLSPDSSRNSQGIELQGLGIEATAGDFGFASRLKRISVETKRRSNPGTIDSYGGSTANDSPNSAHTVQLAPPTLHLQIDSSNDNHLSAPFEQRAPNRLRMSRELREDYQNNNGGGDREGFKRYSVPSTLSITDSIATTLTASSINSDEEDEFDQEDNNAHDRYLKSPTSAHRNLSTTSSGLGFEDRWKQEQEQEEVFFGNGLNAIVDRSGEVLNRDDITSATTHFIAPRLANPAYLSPMLEMAASTMAHKLVVLDLSFNGLTEIPSIIGNCRSLQELDIKGNPLASGDLPSFLTSQVCLRVIIADQCGLTELHTTLAPLQFLHTLSLRGNRLMSLPGYISRLSSLEVLLVNENPFGKQWTSVVKSILFDTSTSPTTPNRNSLLSPNKSSSNGGSPVTQSPGSFSPQSSPSLSSASASSPKWGKILGGSSSSNSSEIPPAMPRQKSSRNIFGKKVVSPSTARTPTSRVVEMDAYKRRSYLPVQDYPPPPPPTVAAAPSRSSPRSNSTSSQSTPQPVDHAAGLKSVMAYLRDLDDLTPLNESTSTPAPATNGTVSPPPPPYASPSSNSGTFPSTKREKSGRLLSNINSVGSKTDSYQDDVSSLNDSKRSSTAIAGGGGEMKLRSDPVKREQVLKEIVASEVSYLRGLEELCHIYIRPGSVDVPVRGGRKDSMVPKVERRIVFGNLEDIRDFHERILLPDLEDALQESTRGDATPIANVFIRHAAVLKIYAPYVTAFDIALARLDTWSVERRTSAASHASNSTASSTPVLDASYAGAPEMSSSQRRRVKEFLRTSRNDPRHTQISLQSYLLLPIQRLPRYRMLLESLLSCTPIDDSAPTHLLRPHPVVQEALEVISNVASDLNERKRESEGRLQLVYWQNRIGMKFRSPLVQPHRSMLRCGTLGLVRVVKLVAHGMDDGPAYEGEPHIMSLHKEIEAKSLVCLLCTDIMVFVHAPADPSDVTGPVELFTVLRLAQPAGSPGSASICSDNTLRVVCDSRAILYFNFDKRNDTLSWMNAINLQQALNS